MNTVEQQARALRLCMDFVRAMSEAQLPEEKAKQIWRTYVEIERLLFEIGALPEP